MDIIRKRSNAATPLEPAPSPPAPTPETQAQKGFIDMMGAYMALLPENIQRNLRLKLLGIVQEEVNKYENK